MPRVAGVALPDCTARPAAHVLTPAQRRGIIEALAKGGKKALEDWLKEEERRDPHIRRRLEEERERLEREARMERRRVEEEYGRERGAAESAWESKMREQSAREAELRSRLESARQGPSLSMDDLVRRSGLFRAAQPEPERGVLAKIGRFFQRLWLSIVRAWVRFVRTLRSLFGKQPDRAETVITLPDGLQLDLGQMTSMDPRFVAQIRMRMRENASTRERLKQWWDRMLGREDYAETARRLMQEELDKGLDAKRLDLEAEAASLEDRLRQMEREEREAVRSREDELRSIDESRRRDLEELEHKVRQGPYEAARDEVLEELAEAGLVDSGGDPTEALLQRFSGLLYDEARRSLPGGGRTTPGTYAGGEGEYHKAPLQSLNERGAVELVDSVINARLRHPHIRHLYDQDLMVHREVRTAKTHVVVIFDQSGSMEEKDRLQAAKTMSLVMYRAVKEADPNNRVDLIAMSTGVEHVDLAGCWNAEPKGFTNHGAALREARHLLEYEGADRRLVYLVTDGLPEAMTVNGVDTADRPEVCMPYALEQAKQLGQLEGVRLFVLQLETQEELYVDAARQIAEAAGGTVDAVEPDELTKLLLVDFGEQQAEADAPVV